jgi:hypothetical protein
MKLKTFSLNQEGVYQNEERLSFQIHGQEGPHSYRYGYDTGNGYVIIYLPKFIDRRIQQSILKL